QPDAPAAASTPIPATPGRVRRRRAVAVGGRRRRRVPPVRPATATPADPATGQRRRHAVHRLRVDPSARPGHRPGNRRVVPHGGGALGGLHRARAGTGGSSPYGHSLYVARTARRSVPRSSGSGASGRPKRRRLTSYILASRGSDNALWRILTP